MYNVITKITARKDETNMADTNKNDDLKVTINSLAKEVKKTGRKVADKTVKMADAATTRIKLQSCSVKLSAEYENLGKLSYNKLVKDRDNTEKIAASIEKIDSLRAEIELLKNELAEKLKKLNNVQ